MSLTLCFITLCSNGGRGLAALAQEAPPAPAPPPAGQQIPAAPQSQAQPVQQAQQAAQSRRGLNWDQVKTLFEAANPTLKGDALGVDELKAQEITAYLRPNPQYTLESDGTQFLPRHGVYQPFLGSDIYNQLSYLHERDHKRELRLESARQGTQIGQSQHLDVERNLIFTLRSAFVQTLEAKALLELAKVDLDYYDKIIDISRIRLKDGDIAQIDFDRIDLQRVQYESELQMAIVGLRTQKIQLLQLLNDRTPVEQFEVSGPFDFAESLRPLEDFHGIAATDRPDLAAAFQMLQQAKTNHKLAESNGSTDPTVSAWETYNASNNNPNAYNSLGVSVQIPLRIFDRNQGEKKRTLIDIDKNQQMATAATAQVFSDVDSAYEQVRSNLELLKAYKARYSDEATHVRDTVSYAYFHGGASLVDFLGAQSDYRVVQTAYLQLIGTYLVAAAQLNLSVGREVIQ